MGTKLYVGNLNYNTNEASLREAFGANGREVTSVSIIMDRETGRSRGFAFVELATPEAAQAALQELDGQELDGRQLRINEAREREARAHESHQRVEERVRTADKLDPRVDHKSDDYNPDTQRLHEDPAHHSTAPGTAPVAGQDETVHDPACGTGGFLLSAYDHMKVQSQDRAQQRKLREHSLSGTDIVDEVVRLCGMNLYLHGIGNGESPIRSADALASDPGERYDVILTNPPFGKKSSYKVIGEDGGVNTEREDYGDARLLGAALGRGRDASARDLLEAINADMVGFTDAALQHDDMTMIVLRFD